MCIINKYIISFEKIYIPVKKKPKKQICHHETFPPFFWTLGYKRLISSQIFKFNKMLIKILTGYFDELYTSYSKICTGK